MTTSTTVTTENEAREAIDKIVKKTYEGFGFRADTADRIVASLTDATQMNRKYTDETREPSISAEYVRKALWSFSGGTVSAAITSHLFIELGRENELGYLPAEGMLEGYEKD